MLTSKKEQAQKEKKSLFVKDIVTKNPIFSKEHIEEFYTMFNLYCDAKRQCDIGDILNTAKTLGFQKKYKIVYEAIASITQELNGTWIDFQTFLSLLTDKIGNPFSQNGRKAMFNLIDPENKNILDFDDLTRISEQMKFNLGPQQIQEVINNVAGFGKAEITRDQFYKYITKKVEKKNLL